MRKNYFLLCFLLLSFVAAATEVNLDFKGNEFNLPTTTDSNDSKDAFKNPIVKQNIKITFYKNDGTNPPLMWYSEYNNTIDARCYNKNSFTIESTNGEPITSIAFTHNGKFDVASTPAGEWTGDDYSTWRGEAPMVTFVVGVNKAQMYSILVTTKSGAVSVVAPQFTPSFTALYEPTSIALSSATAGSSIFYTIDGSTPTKESQAYTAPFVISQPTTIKAIAVLGDVISDISTMQYIFPTHLEVNSIAEFVNLESSDLIRIGSPVTVTYQSGNYVYLRDNSGSLQIYGALDRKYSNGDVIQSGIVGTRNMHEGTMQMLPEVTTFREAIKNEPALPYEVTLQQVDESLANSYVIGRGWTLNVTKSGSKYSYEASDDAGHTLPLYEKFKNITMPTVSGVYDITGIVNVYGTTLQLYPTLVQVGGGVSEIESSKTHVTASKGTINVIATIGADVNVYSVNGIKCHAETLANDSVEIAATSGIYIITVDEDAFKVVVR